MPQGGAGKGSARKDWSLGVWDGSELQNQLLIDLQTPGVPNPSAFLWAGSSRGSPPSGKALVLGCILVSDLRIF